MKAQDNVRRGLNYSEKRDHFPEYLQGPSLESFNSCEQWFYSPDAPFDGRHCKDRNDPD